MRDYELVTLLHPDLEIDLDKPLNKIIKLVEDNKGKITKQDVWGKRKLAYPINKEEFAVYVYYEIQLPPERVQKLDSALNITDEVLRHLITHPVPVQEEESSKEEPDKTKAKKKNTRPKESNKDKEK